MTAKDGPAAGVSMMLKRSPLFLRLTRDRAGKWDGLDMHDDRPHHDESVVVYMRGTKPTMCHIKMSGAGSGFYSLADYYVVANQPTDDIVRSNTLWQRWCVAQLERIKATLPHEQHPD